MAKFYKEVYDLRPWFHNFSSFGIETDFGLNNYPTLYSKIRHFMKIISGQYRYGFALHSYINQRNKMEFILPYLYRAFNEVRTEGVEKPTFLEIFCADGFYSFWAKKFCRAGYVKGVDNDPKAIKQCLLMQKILNVYDMEFECMDVFDLKLEEKFGIVLCAGGLYHISKPKELLEKVYQITKKFLVLQTVITLETEDPDYFVTPAPGWKHGCRFSDARLRIWLEEIGWKIIDYARNELEGNLRLVDKGSVYYLLLK